MFVTIYTIQNNMYCVMAKKYLEDKKIKYHEYDISEDIEKAREMEEKAQHIGVPVIEIGGKIVIGYDKKKLDKILD